jgi:diguanylate cyclase (GGDEF)-like protein
MIEQQQSAQDNPLKAVLVAGTVTVMALLSGTAWFTIHQIRLLHSLEVSQSSYIELADFRTALTICSDKTDSPVQKKLLRFKHANLVRKAEINKSGRLAVWLQENSRRLDSLNRENLDLLLLELDDIITATRTEIHDTIQKTAAVSHIYVAFVLAVLIILVFTGGWLIVSSYKHSLIPLHMLARRLSHLNKHIPESIHDTAEEIKKSLAEEGYSPEIHSVTESLVNLCEDIEAKNKKLDELHIRDEKTNLYNYRYFKEHLVIDVERAKRFKNNVSLAMIDIDHFKEYNDRFGHIAGDRVLVRFSEIIREQCRTTDVPSRFGGEEFALLLPKTDRQTALEIAERLRKVLSDEPIENENEMPATQLTVSIGIASYPVDAADWYSLINNADKALYLAKSSGRNRVVAFPSSENRT